MTVFGSSNWTASSSDSQREHNYFTLKPWFVQWFIGSIRPQVEQRDRDGRADVAARVRRLRARVSGSAGQHLAGERRAGSGQLGDAALGRRVLGASLRHLLRHGAVTPASSLSYRTTRPAPRRPAYTSVKESYTFTEPSAGRHLLLENLGQDDGRSEPSTARPGDFTTSGGGTIPPAPTGLAGAAVTTAEVDLDVERRRRRGRLQGRAQALEQLDVGADRHDGAGRHDFLPTSTAACSRPPATTTACAPTRPRATRRTATRSR